MNKYDLGNIFDDKSIKNIYGGDKIKKYKKLISDYSCNDCQYSVQCRGGCQVRKIINIYVIIIGKYWFLSHFVVYYTHSFKRERNDNKNGKISHTRLWRTIHKSNR